MIGSSIRLYVSCPLQPCAGWVGWCFHNLTRVPQLQVLCGKFSIWTLGPFNCATVDILHVKAISPCPLKIWVLDLGAKGRPESLLWRLSSQSFMVSDAPGSNISTVAWLCSYHYTFILSITRSCGLVLFLSLTRPNSDIRWGFNDLETWLFPQLSRHSVSSRVIQTPQMIFILSPYPASFPTLLTGHYSILNSSKLLIHQSLP